MEQKNITEQLKQEIAQLKLLTRSLIARVKHLEQDNVRIKHEARLVRSSQELLRSHISTLRGR